MLHKCQQTSALSWTGTGCQLPPHSFLGLAAVRGKGKGYCFWEQTGECLQNYLQIPCVASSCQSHRTWPCVGEGRAFIHTTTPKSRKRGDWEPEPACFFGFKLMLSYASFFPQWFSHGGFFTLPIQTYDSASPAASHNSAFLFCLCLLLPTSKMLEWELGWPLCWWQMKEKQTQLACLQLQWFSRAGSSKDILFVDKTHNSKLWEGAEIDGISVRSSACPACTFRNPSLLCWLNLEQLQWCMVPARWDQEGHSTRGCEHLAGSTEQITTCHLQWWCAWAYTVFVNLACMCVHVFR